jgi:hypothetical protein
VRRPSPIAPIILVLSFITGVVIRFTRATTGAGITGAGIIGITASTSVITSP